MDERMELGALRPDDLSRERMIRAIMARAAPELARRATVDVSPMLVLAEWLRPAMAAAAVVALVCLSVLAVTDPGPTAGAGLTDELAVPRPASEWLVDERAPTISDLLVAMGSEGR
jgi:hypothetical protein